MIHDPGPLAGPGHCWRCEREVPDAILVHVVERGSGPPAGIAGCVACARQMADQAPQYVGPWVARDLAKLAARARDAS